jgi:hypothetical protein
MKRELARRTNRHGEHVRLVWDATSGAVAIELSDGEGVERHARVPSDQALAAFRDPYLYVDPTCLATGRLVAA